MIGHQAPGPCHWSWARTAVCMGRLDRVERHGAASRWWSGGLADVHPSFDARRPASSALRRLADVRRSAYVGVSAVLTTATGRRPMVGACSPRVGHLVWACRRAAAAHRPGRHGAGRRGAAGRAARRGPLAFGLVLLAVGAVRAAPSLAPWLAVGAQRRGGGRVRLAGYPFGPILLTVPVLALGQRGALATPSRGGSARPRGQCWSSARTALRVTRSHDGETLGRSCSAPGRCGRRSWRAAFATGSAARVRGRVLARRTRRAGPAGRVRGAAADGAGAARRRRPRAGGHRHAGGRRAARARPRPGQGPRVARGDPNDEPGVARRAAHRAGPAARRCG